MIAREGLGRYAHALDLLPTVDRERVESLAALVRGLLDFAREPGFGGERLAKILLWQDRLDMALEEACAEEPVFAAFALQDRRQPWDRAALDRLQTMIRALALTDEEPSSMDLAEVLLILLLGVQPDRPSIDCLVPLLEGESPAASLIEAEKELSDSWLPALRYARLASRGRAPGSLERWWIRLRSRVK